jgi:diguanylate cyclase (GGDEF)-like protein/PAS domain S-box-containing protein
MSLVCLEFTIGQGEFAMPAPSIARLNLDERAQSILNSIGDAVVATNLHGELTYLNKVAENLSGWTFDEAEGLPLHQVLRLVDGKTRLPAVYPDQRAISENKVVSLGRNTLLIRQDGSELPIEDSVAPIHDEAQQITGAVIVFRDVSQARAHAQKLSQLAQHDFLTGLPNRMLLVERIEQAIGLACRREKQGAIFFLDLDGFKQVNDALGHAVGDQVLQETAARLLASVRTTDTVGRQSGDEFIILLPEMGSTEDALRIASNVLHSCATPYLIEGEEIELTISIGICIFPDNGTSLASVMAGADAAMYQAKARGKNKYLLAQRALMSDDGSSYA